jgi:hypothetical protein
VFEQAHPENARKLAEYGQALIFHPIVPGVTILSKVWQ